MQDSPLLIINGTDLTSNIVVPTYKVESKSIYEEWTDANRVEHHDVIRSRVMGTFTLHFETESDYENFLNLINNNKTSGDYLIATVYDNRINTTVNGNFFWEMDLANNIPLFQRGSYDGIDVTIKEC